MGLFQGEVKNHIQISPDIFLLSFHSLEIVKKSKPGQFIHLRVTDGIHPLLRRPFSIHRVHRESGCIDILYRVIGCGTSKMKKMKPGDSLNVLGPLGQGFDLSKDFHRAIIIAGGMGSAPLFYLMDELLSNKKEIFFLWGVKTEQEFFCLSELEKLGIEVTVVTEDGSLGHKGLVTDFLPSVIKKYSQFKQVEGFICGPRTMICETFKMNGALSWNWQVSLEENMACGVGVCQGCAVQMLSGEYQMICKDGPVFNLKDIAFNA